MKRKSDETTEKISQSLDANEVFLCSKEKMVF